MLAVIRCDRGSNTLIAKLVKEYGYNLASTIIGGLELGPLANNSILLR